MNEEKKESMEYINKTNQAIGNRIFNARKNIGLSQEKVRIMICENTGIEISKSKYSRYETGETSIPVYLLISIAEILNTTVDYLITGKKASVSKRIAQYCNLLNDNEKKTMSNLLTAIADSIICE